MGAHDLPSLIADLESVFRGAADPSAAGPMAAYMRHQFAFLGLSRPRRDELARLVLSRHPKLSPDGVLALADWCWAQEEREFQYVACDQLRRVAKKLTADALPEVRGFIERRSWWDTVDVLASRVVGPIVATHRELGAEMDRWIDDDDLWVARTAILHQLNYGADTDAERLFRYCRRQAAHPDFFIRKAIGWALRQYARTDPDAVRRFLVDHGDELSPLSGREASKHLGHR